MGDKSRVEDILEATIANVPYEEPARSRIEELLIELKELVSIGGGGSITLDSQIDETSENAVMNKAIPPFVSFIYCIAMGVVIDNESIIVISNFSRI